MTTTLTKSTKSSAKKGGAPTVVGLPQVNLLPPEVRAARSLAVVKRWLGMGLGVVLVLNVLGFVGATFVRTGAEADLADAQAETTRLQKQEAQYAEVPQVLGSIKFTTEARAAGTSSEVLWRPYLDALTAVLPESVSVESFTVTAATPLDGPVAPSNPLQSPSIGSLTFQGRSLTVPDTAAWLEALATVPGFSDPWVSAVSITEEDDTVFYSVNMSVRLTDAALAHRFAATTEGAN